MTKSVSDLRRLSTLYRYRSLEGQFGQTNAEDILIHNRMYWTSPDKFNDPFDCRPNFIVGRTIQDRRRWLVEASKSQMPDASRQIRRARAREILATGPAQLRKTAIAGFEGMMARSAVCCFSKTPQSLLLWAHYGDSHRGVAFVFEEQVEPEQFFGYDIIYAEQRPEVDVTSAFSEDPVRGLEATILTKGSDWAYEQEKRMVDYRSVPGFRKFPEQALVGVIFGARISDQHKELLIQMTQRRRSKVDLLQAKVSNDQFHVDIQSLP